MSAVKAVQSSFLPSNPFFRPPRRILHNKKLTLSSCNTKDAEPGPGASSPEGDKKKQELLAKIAMLQAQKVRLTDFLDERSAYLTQFAEDANAEFDAIAEDALKGLEDASDRIMENLENRMQTFKESAESSREEIESNERELAEFEDKIEKDRNQGLFFKNLGQKKPEEKVNAKEEAQKLKEITKDNAGSKIRKNIYLALITILVATIVDAVISSSEVEWRKIAALGVILVGLIAQYIYEQSVSSTPENTEEK